MLLFNNNTQQLEEVELKPCLDYLGEDTGEDVATFKDGSFVKFPRQKDISHLVKAHEEANRKESNAIESTPIPVVVEPSEASAETPGGDEPVS